MTPRPEPMPSRHGRVPVWLPLVLAFGGLVVGLKLLQADARSHGLARIDATRYRLHAPAQWFSPAWTEELERLLVAVRALPTDDVDGIRAFAGELRALPFVAEVGEPEVQWPDGLSIPVRLREPVACLRVDGRDFLPVARDGTVLGGYAYAPHEAYGGWLPTIGPHGWLERDGRSILPGQRLDDPVVLAGLDVAESMWRHLDLDHLRALGRVVIDASRPDAPVLDRDPGTATPARLPGGVVLELEHGRRVLFGRPPRPVHEGELPVGHKWAHVGEALEGVSAGRTDWALLDARFDRSVAFTREEVERLGGRVR